MSTCYQPAFITSQPSKYAEDERKRRRPPNMGSKLLERQENEMLFSIVGTDNVSLTAAVVELLFVEEKQWKLTFRGVISLVKDYKNRAYFLRLYDILSGRKLWEFKLYRGFKASGYGNCPCLLTFEDEARQQIYGLNFASVEEAIDFKSHLDKRHEQEGKAFVTRNQFSRNTTVLSSTSGNANSSFTTPLSSGVTPVGTMVHAEKIFTTGNGIGFFSRKDKKKKEKKPRIRKEDISNPTNFQHKAHVGWDQDNGFSNNMCDSEPMDESIQNIIRAAGQDPTSMSKKTIKFVYDFIENYSENYTSTTPAQTYKQPASNAPQWSSIAPPPPSRTVSHHPNAPPSRPPPPPPAISSPLRPAVKSQVQSAEPYRPPGVPPPPPPPPPLSFANVNAVPPPPPPPLPPSSVNLNNSTPAKPLLPTVSPGSGKGDLLAEIQAGKQLRSIAAPIVQEKPTSDDVRGNVMAQIRQGAQLKHVSSAAEDEKRRSGSALADVGGIADALAKALEERRMNMALDDSSDEEVSDERNEWSD